MTSNIINLYTHNVVNFEDATDSFGSEMNSAQWY